MIQYFSLCKGYCSEGSDTCWDNPAYYFCIFNSSILLVIGFLLLIKLIFVIVTHRRNIGVSAFTKTFQQSIFSYLHKDSPKVSYMLYFTMAYGVFFARPLGFVLFNYFVSHIFTNLSESWIIFIATLVNAITSTLYFFSVIFMVNFYGVKAEILCSKGDLSISEKERELFLKMVLKRTEMFSITFFFGTLLEASFMDAPFAISGVTAIPKYEWTVRTISYSFVAILLINRLYYVKYAKKMMREHTAKKNKMYSVISFKKHLENHTLTKEMLPGLLENVRGEKNESQYIEEVQKLIVQKCGQSSFLFDDTLRIINNSSKSFYQPILRNSMENHLAGTLWLFFTLFDTILNAGCSSLMGFFFIINPDIDQSTSFSVVLTFLMFVFYALETTLQALLAHLIVTSKGNFGEYLEVDSSFSASSDYEHPFMKSEVHDNGLNRSIPYATIETDDSKTKH